MHGRNGRVDRFPSLDPPHPLFLPNISEPPRRGLGVVEAPGDSGGNDGRRSGRNGRGSLAQRAVQCRACAPRVSFHSLSLSLFLLHEDSTRCDRNLCRRRTNMRVTANPKERAGGEKCTRKRMYACMSHVYWTRVHVYGKTFDSIGGGKGEDCFSFSLTTRQYRRFREDAIRDITNYKFGDRSLRIIVNREDLLVSRRTECDNFRYD